MSWFTERRLDYIDWRLLNWGAVQRQHIADEFGVNPSVASRDLAAFERAYPGAMAYDLSAKQYTAARPYVSRRGQQLGPLAFPARDTPPPAQAAE